MQTLGIVGGVGPESTIDYYRSIIASYRRRTADGTYPALLINSIEATGLLRKLTAGENEAVTTVLVGAVRQLERAGADVALFASVSTHVAFDAVARQTSIPLVSIVEATCRAAQAAGRRRLGLFGTRMTMESAFFARPFTAASIEIVVPEEDERAYIHETYFGELIHGTFLAETRARLEAIVAAMKARSKIDGLILGGTELPLIMRESTYSGIPVLDTTRIHVEAAVDRILEEPQR